VSAAKERSDELMRPTAAGSRWRLPGATRVALPLLLIGLLAGCLLPPEPKTEAAQDVFNLYVAILVLAGIVFVGVEGFIVYAIVRYRRKPGDDALPPQVHGNTLIEIIWTAIPSLIVAILFVLSIITLGEVEARSAQPGVTIDVTGFTWNWRFRYPDGTETEPGTPDKPAVLAVPVGEPVRLRLHSTDVIHAFFVPHFLIKRDMVPVGENGTPNELEFTVTEPGTYSGQCAEFCGDGHAEMTFVIEAMARPDYEAFVAALARGEPPPPPPGGGECPTTLEVTAEGSQFNTAALEVPAGEAFCIAFENRDAGIPHNVAIYAGGEPIFQGEALNDAGSITYQVPALDPGEYEFICDFHPTTMVGTLTATE
jgi:cytochrome c oxidase subunit 2